MLDFLRIDPLAAYNFHVRLGVLEFGFSKASGLQREAEPVTYQEGGLNDRVHVLPGQVKNCGTLHLERGAYAGEYFPFYLVGEKLSIPLRLELWNEANSMFAGKVYTLVGLVVKKFEAGEMDAAQNVLLIDRFDLSYEYMYISPG